MYHNEAVVNDNYVDDDDKVFIFSHHKERNKGCRVVEKRCTHNVTIRRPSNFDHQLSG